MPCDLSMEQIYHFLDQLPTLIGMEPILRPVVVTDKVQNHSIISGLTVIAQSHISVHYYLEEHKAYIDIFSCSFINCDNIDKIVEQMLGIKCETVLISRGSKHARKTALRSEVIKRYNKWQNNII